MYLDEGIKKMLCFNHIAIIGVYKLTIAIFLFRINRQQWYWGIFMLYLYIYSASHLSLCMTVCFIWRMEYQSSGNVLSASTEQNGYMLT